MKISKLFHWLYAILMLLPFLVFLPNAFYYGFNEHAVAQEKTDYEYVEINFNQLVPSLISTTEISGITITNNGNNTLTINGTATENIGSSSNPYHISGLVNYPRRNHRTLIYFSENQSPTGLFFGLSGYSVNIRSYAFTRYTDNSDWQGYLSIYIPSGTTINNFVIAPQVFDLTKAYGENDTLTYNTFVIQNPDIPYSYTLSDYKYVINPSYTYTTNMSITDSMSYAWDSVWHNDLFSWSYGTFLTEPFIYIGNVFNVPVDNSLYSALSYWLDISIIWLCFDLVMYIPLLVHRWLDKGIIE